jgi:hypothetical protein
LKKEKQGLILKNKEEPAIDYHKQIKNIRAKTEN